jgi:hypothetical protein
VPAATAVIMAAMVDALRIGGLEPCARCVDAVTHVHLSALLAATSGLESPPKQGKLNSKETPLKFLEMASLSKPCHRRRRQVNEVGAVRARRDALRA